MKLFLDDERSLPPGCSGYTLAKSSREAKLQVRNHIDELEGSFFSLDYFLGGNDTSLDFLEWLINQIERNDVNPKTITMSFHSSDQHMNDRMKRMWQACLSSSAEAM